MTQRAGRESAPTRPDAGRFVIECFALSTAWIGLMVLAREAGWLPADLGESPQFGWALAVGCPVLGVLYSCLRIRPHRARSTD